jgi:FkbM family methyltransferase
MLDSILYHAWYGPLRRPLRPVLHRILPRRHRVISGPLRGSHFDGPETSCRLGIYELQIQRTMRRLLRAGDVVYDLGANNGYLSLLAARCVGDDGHVYSFDPLPVNVSRITSLMAANQIEHQETVPNAVADRAGLEHLYLTGEADTYTASLIRQERPHEMMVGVTTLDEFIASHRRPDLVKMDVEGAEMLILLGASKLLSDDLPWLTPRYWLIEVHTPQLEGEVTARLARHGYQIEPLENRYARKPYPRHILARQS